MLPKRILILGGVSSGKSKYAEGLLRGWEDQRSYIATARAGDAEMAAKIAAHQVQRGGGWQVLDGAVDCAGALAAADNTHAVLLDSVSMWVSNVVLDGGDVDARLADLIAALEARAAPMILVSDEVGLGGIAANRLARGFAVTLGGVNQRLAALCDTVIFVAAGCPLAMKGAMPCP